MEEIWKRVTDKDDKAAYGYAQQIIAASAGSDKYLALIPTFAGLLEDSSSYVRTRGFVLICAQARWAEDRGIKEVWERMMPLLQDSKPTVVRQCLHALEEVALYRPEMSEKIEKALDGIDICRYRDSMAPLIEKDIARLRKLL